MFRQFPMFVFLVLAATAGLQDAAHAQAESQLAPAEEILTTLLSRGYVIVENERTWLGRQRILAEKDGRQREVVFVPGTGEILRDYSVATPFLAAPPQDEAERSRRAEGSISDGRTGVSGTANASPSVDTGGVGTGMTAPADAGLLP